MYCEQLLVSVYLDPDYPLEWLPVLLSSVLPGVVPPTTREHLEIYVWKG